MIELYYRLNSGYELRGWELLPFALCDSRNGDVSFIRKNLFLLLYHCDGLHDISKEKLLKDERDYLDSLLNQGVISEVLRQEGISEGQKYKKYDSRFIGKVHWSMTGKCNYKCRHCLISAPHAKFGELSHDECIKIIHELASCGIRQVSVTGGEPLARKDFFELVDEMSRNGIIMTDLFSNGRLVTDELLDQLEQHRFQTRIHISFDGVGWHDWLRGIPGAEKTALDAFALCRERGFTTMAGMCIHRNNMHTFRETIKLLGKLGVSHVKVGGINPIGEWLEMPDTLTLSGEELYDTFYEYMCQFFEEGMPVALSLSNFFACEKGSVEYRIPFCKYEDGCDCADKSVCAYARNVLFISPEGFVLPCMPLADTNLGEEFPSILEIPLKEILTDSYYMKMIDIRMKDYLEHNPECKKCKYVNQCGAGCRARALSAGGTDYLGIDKDTCFFFRNGYVEKIKAAADEAINKINV